MNSYYYAVALLGLLVCSAGCTGGTYTLTQDQATERVRSLDHGVPNAPFSLGSGIYDGDAVIYYLKIESDGGVSLARASVEHVKFYYDTTAESAYVELRDVGGGYMQCEPKYPIDRCKYWADRNYKSVYQFHVPNGTVIRPFNVGGRGDGDSDDGNYAANYYAVRSIGRASGLP
jgi:uncharacterized protein YuzE